VLAASLEHFKDANKYANQAETSLKLFQAVSVFCFSFISQCTTGFSNKSGL